MLQIPEFGNIKTLFGRHVADPVPIGELAKLMRKHMTDPNNTYNMQILSRLANIFVLWNTFVQ